LALAILIDYFPTKPGGKALAEALYQPFKFTVIAALPACWKMNFEEVGIALCRTLTDEPDLLNRVISSLESAVLDEIVGRQEKNEPLNPADLSIVGAITEMLSETFSMRWAFAASLVERQALSEEVGAVAWDKVVELLMVNRLIEPRSELFIHEKWYPQTAMSALLDSDERVAETR
jgi:hypothetical protein